MTWHLEQVSFWSKILSETQKYVIRQGQGGEGDL